MIARCLTVGLLQLTVWTWAGISDGREAASRDSSPGNHTFSITVQGAERHYLVHLPRGYDSHTNWPVVIMFHGGGGKATGAMRETGWADKADQAGFLAVFPEGTPPDPSHPASFLGNPQTWNDGSKRSNVGAVERRVPDVKFVAAMIVDLKTRFAVDKRRIYATGFSNGASLTFRVMRELSSTIAAAAPVAGADWLSDHKPARAVPLLYITGTQDPLNPIAGGPVRIGLKTFGSKPPVETMIRNWVKLEGCQETPRVVHDHDGAKGVAYSTPGGRDAVVFYTLAGHGHHWPGGRSLLPERLAGPDVSKLKATDVIWAFFKTNALPAE